MAIGDIKLRTGRSIQQNENIIPGQFGAGVAKAISSLGSAAGDVAIMTAGLQERKVKTEALNAQADYAKMQGVLNRDILKVEQSAAPGAYGHANTVDAMATEATKAFLGGLSPKLQKEYASVVERQNQARTTKAFLYEFEAGNAQSRVVYSEIIQGLAEDLSQGKTDLAAANLNAGLALWNTDLNQKEQDRLTKVTDEILATASFKQKLAEINAPNVPGKPLDPSGKTQGIAMLGGLPWQRSLLAVISKLESGNRNVRNDGTAKGAEITDSSHHPEIMTTLLDGTPTSASGFYQINSASFKDAAAALALKDFSRASQDKAAIWLAKRNYKNNEITGYPTLNDALTSGKLEVVTQALESLQSVWTALKGKIPESAKAIMEGTASAAQGRKVTSPQPNSLSGVAIAAAQPDILNDSTYAAIPLALREKLIQEAELTAQRVNAAASKEQQAQHTTIVEAIMLGIDTGEVVASDRAAFRDRGASYKELKTFDAAIKRKDAQLATTDELDARMRDPNAVFSLADDAAFNASLGPKARNALSAMDKGFVFKGLIPVVQQTGFIPSELATVLETMTTVGTLKQRTFAFDVLANLQAQNPAFIERSKGMSKGMKNRIGQYAAMKPFFSQEEIKVQMKLLSDPAYAKQYNDSVDSAVKEFNTNVSNDNILNEIDTYNSFQADAPLTEQQQFLFRKETSMLYARGRALGLDSSASLTYAVKDLQRQWGTSTTGDITRMMRNPPSRYYPAIDGSHTWIDYLARRDAGLTSDQIYSLVADPQTIFAANQFASFGPGKDPKTGKPLRHNASYTVSIIDVEGNPTTLVDPVTKVPIRVAFNADDPELKAVRDWNSQVENAVSDLAATRDAYDELTPEELTRTFTLEGLTPEEDLKRLRAVETAARASRPGGINADKTTLRLLSDQEAEAQKLFDLPGGVPLSKSGLYRQLVVDIEQRGGTLPSKAEDK